MRFGQREGPFQLDRVLGRQDQEGARQRHRLALDRHRALGHRFEQRALRARGGAVDLVGQDDVGEDRAGAKLEFALSLVVSR